MNNMGQTHNTTGQQRANDVGPQHTNGDSFARIFQLYVMSDLYIMSNAMRRWKGQRHH